MTEVPEVGSKWICKFGLREGDECEVLYSDACSVLVGHSSGYRDVNKPDAFATFYKPAPRIRKYQRWVNLYSDGRIGDYHETERTALARAREQKEVVETRLIEWEVEE